MPVLSTEPKGLAPKDMKFAFWGESRGRCAEHGQLKMNVVTLVHKLYKNKPKTKTQGLHFSFSFIN